jgi:hypothetical protein
MFASSFHDGRERRRESVKRVQIEIYSLQRQIINTQKSQMLQKSIPYSNTFWQMLQNYYFQ